MSIFYVPSCLIFATDFRHRKVLDWQGPKQNDRPGFAHRAGTSCAMCTCVCVYLFVFGIEGHGVQAQPTITVAKPVLQILFADEFGV